METDYKIGDWVVMPSERPNGWNSAMERDYLNKIVQINRIEYNGRFQFEGWVQFGYYLYELAGKASEEQIAEELVKRKKEEEQKKRQEKENKEMIAKALEGCIYTPERIRDVAIGIFGEERVDVVISHENSFSLHIHFPIIDITNSSGDQHCIKDLYVKFTIHLFTKNALTGDGYLADIRFEGNRSTVSLKEYQSGYRHSHLVPNCKGFSDFCLGSSVFGELISNVRASLSEMDWELMLYSLENYVKWESIEGGPYAYIRNICYKKQIATSTIQNEAERLATGIPKHLWSYGGDGLKLITWHPDLYEYFNTYSTIKNISTYTKEEKQQLLVMIAEKEKGRTSVCWKGVNIPFRVYCEEEVEENSISPEVVSRFCSYLNNKGNIFLKQKSYFDAKREYSKKVFGETRTKQQAHAHHSEAVEG